MSSGENNILKVTFVLDVIGRPPKHLVESLERVSEEIDKERGTKITSKEIKEPTKMKDNPKFYTTFMELNLEFENIEYLMISVFKYMPAHIEIVEPEVVALSNNGLNDILNELVRRLHGYDEITRAMQMENQKLRQMVSQFTGQPTQTPMSPKANLQSSEKTKKKSKKPKSKSKKSKRKGKNKSKK